MAAPNVASVEGQLLEHTQRLERHKRDRIAVHVRLSELRPQNRRDYHVRIAASTFENLVKLLQGQLFVLSNSDFVFIYKGTGSEEIEGAIFKVRSLFAEDPLLLDDSGLGFNEFGGKFVRWYKLVREYDEFLLMVQQLVVDDQIRARAARQAGAPPEPLTPEILGSLEEKLAHIDMVPQMQRQSVCAIIGKNAPQAVFSEIYVAINDLRNAHMPNIDLSSNRWLFQHLTTILDQRMLELLGRESFRPQGHVSINVNVATLMSPLFTKFDENIKGTMRGTMMVELQKIDIFSDMSSYFFVRDFIHERGYRIILDGLTNLTLPFVEREKLGADLAKLIWTPEMLEDTTHRMDLMDAVKRTGETRMVMCRCDSPEAIQFGQSIGISLFQGRHVERLLRDANAPAHVMT